MADGYFSANNKDYHWWTFSFKDEITERETDNVTLRELHRPGYLILGVENEETKKVEYETIITPYEDWDSVEYILEQDWGNEGSRKE